MANRDVLRPMNNRSIPSVSVIPVLHYDDVRAAVAWLIRAFDCAERLQIADHRAQMMIAGGAFVIADGGGSGPSLERTHSVMVRVQGLDAHHARALAAGARVVNPPTNYPFGERQYTALDLGGHAWTFTETLRDVHPSEWGGTLIA